MALGCVRDSKRRIHRPVVSEFDQGGGSGADEPGTSNPNRVAVFFYLSQKSRFLFLTVAERAEIDPFFTCAESAVFSFYPAPKVPKSIPFLPVRKVRFSLFYHGKKRNFRRPSFGVFFGVTTVKIGGGSRCSYAVTSEGNRRG